MKIGDTRVKEDVRKVKIQAGEKGPGQVVDRNHVLLA
jgi:hypothetical protein